MWLVLASVWAASFVYPYSPLDGEILCVWRRITTLDCPGCGLTRSFCAMSQIQIRQAFVLHPVGPLLYLAMVWVVLSAAVRHFQGTSEFFRLPPRIVRGYWIMAGVIFIIHFAATVASWVTP
jgi:hypothetical protein